MCKKETLKNVEVNNNKMFIGVDQTKGQNKINVLVINHRAMASHGRE